MRSIDPDPLDLEITSLVPRTPGQIWRTRTSRWLRSWPGRLALSALVCMLIVGALVGIVARSTHDPLEAARNALGIATPTATPVIPPGGGVFAVIDEVPWGSLRIDGQSPTFMAMATGPLGKGFILARGVHHVLYQARHFPTLSCVVSVPQAQSDTCPLGGPSKGSAGVSNLLYNRILDLRATPDHLASGQYQALLAAARRTLAAVAASTTIQPGERYINQLGQIQVAHAAMTFTITMRQVLQNDPACPMLCPATIDGVAGAPSAEWSLMAQFEPVWTVTDASRVSFTADMGSSASQTARLQYSVTLAAIPLETGWSVTVQDSDPLGSTVQFTALQAVETQIGKIGPALVTSSGANPADGAVVIDETVTDSYVILWRFGILYAANSVTHAVFPSLPLASPTDQALARQMAPTPGN